MNTLCDKDILRKVIREYVSTTPGVSDIILMANIDSGFEYLPLFLKEMVEDGELCETVDTNISYKVKE